MSNFVTKRGVIIKIREYLPTKRCIFFFSREGELITLFTSNFSKKWQQLSYVIPFTQVELTYSINSDYSYLREAIILSQIDLYEQTVAYIEVIGKISATILYSQMPGKVSPLLYALSVSYTSYLSKSSEPHTLLCSFYLKLLRYEGLIDFSNYCENIDIFSSLEERQEVKRLAYAKKFIDINQEISLSLKNKIFNLFDSLFYE